MNKANVIPALALSTWHLSQVTCIRCCGSTGGCSALFGDGLAEEGKWDLGVKGWVGVHWAGVQYKAECIPAEEQHCESMEAWKSLVNLVGNLQRMFLKRLPGTRSVRVSDAVRGSLDSILRRVGILMSFRWGEVVIMVRFTFQNSCSEKEAELRGKRERLDSERCVGRRLWGRTQISAM